MARKSTVAYAKSVLTPAQFKAWQRMPVKLSKSELAVGKRPPGSRKAAPKRKALPKRVRQAFKGLDVDQVDVFMDMDGMTREDATAFVRLLQKHPNYPAVDDDYFDWASEQFPAKKSNPPRRKGKRAPNRRKIKPGMPVTWVDRHGRKQAGVVHTARAKSSTVIGRDSMRFEEQLNRDLYPYAANPARRISRRR